MVEGAFMFSLISRSSLSGFSLQFKIFHDNFLCLCTSSE